MFCQTPAGIAVPTSPRPSRRPARLTCEQIHRTRQEDWRRQHDDGVPDLDGVVRRRSLREIARIAGRSLRTVRDGIASARIIREALAHVRDREAG